MTGIQSLSFGTNFSSAINYPKLHASPAGWAAYQNSNPTVAGTGGLMGTNQIGLDATGAIIQVGNLTPGSTRNAPSNAFLSKITSAGAAGFYNVLSPSGTANNVYLTDVKCDTANNIYAVGYQVDLTLTQKPFVMKLTSAGVISWYSTFYKDNTTTNAAVNISSPSIAITPNSASPVITVSATVVNSTGGLDMVLLRYPNAGGTPTWSRSITFSGVTTDTSRTTYQVTTDTSDNVYAVTGYKDATVNFYGALVKYNSAGTFQWSTNVGLSTNNFDVSGVCTDDTTSVYVTYTAGFINQYSLSTGAATNQWGNLNGGSVYSRATYSSATTPWGNSGGPIFSQFASVVDPLNANTYAGASFVGGGIPYGTMLYNGASQAVPVVADSTYFYFSMNGDGGIIKAPLNGSGYNNDPSSYYFGINPSTVFPGGSYKYYSPTTTWTTYGLSGAANNPVTQSTGTITVSATLNIPTNTVGSPTRTGLLALY